MGYLNKNAILKAYKELSQRSYFTRCDSESQCHKTFYGTGFLLQNQRKEL